MKDRTNRVVLIIAVNFRPSNMVSTGIASAVLGLPPHQRVVNAEGDLFGYVKLPGAI